MPACERFRKRLHALRYDVNRGVCLDHVDELQDVGMSRRPQLSQGILGEGKQILSIGYIGVEYKDGDL